MISDPSWSILVSLLQRSPSIMSALKGHSR
jgi:hypothetical protein